MSKENPDGYDFVAVCIQLAFWVFVCFSIVEVSNSLSDSAKAQQEMVEILKNKGCKLP